jgi:hypothetical protein
MLGMFDVFTQKCYIYIRKHLDKFVINLMNNEHGQNHFWPMFSLLNGLSKGFKWFNMTYWLLGTFYFKFAK